jgi:hypothetical protein
MERERSRAVACTGIVERSRFAEWLIGHGT